MDCCPDTQTDCIEPVCEKVWLSGGKKYGEPDGFVAYVLMCPFWYTAVVA